MKRLEIPIIARYFYISAKQVEQGPFVGHAKKARKVYIWWLRTKYQLPYDLISRVTSAPLSSCHTAFNYIENAVQRGDKMYQNICNQLKDNETLE